MQTPGEQLPVIVRTNLPMTPFSTVDDSAGNPRVVAGTLGGTGTTPGGSTASFVGAFFGATLQFE